eukprot:693444-Rhodomonas_salina.1
MECRDTRLVGLRAWPGGSAQRRRLGSTGRSVRLPSTEATTSCSGPHCQCPSQAQRPDCLSRVRGRLGVSHGEPEADSRPEPRSAGGHWQLSLKVKNVSTQRPSVPVCCQCPSHYTCTHAGY